MQLFIPSSVLEHLSCGDLFDLFQFFLVAFYHESCAYVNPVDANIFLSILMVCSGRNKQRQNLEEKVKLTKTSGVDYLFSRNSS